MQLPVAPVHGCRGQGQYREDDDHDCECALSHIDLSYPTPLELPDPALASLVMTVRTIPRSG